MMRLSRNRLLADLYRSHRSLFLESKRLLLAKRKWLLESLSEHKRLLKALQMRDPEGGQLLHARAYRRAALP